MDAHTQEPGHVFLDAEEFLKFAEKEIGGGRFDRKTGKFERAKASSAGIVAPGADEAPEPDPEHEANASDTIPPAQKEPTPEPLRDRAYFGTLGAIVRKIEPQTEADPAALLVQLIVAAGNVMGRSHCLRVDGSRHFGNLFTVICGDTGMGRKGTALRHVRDVLREVDEIWPRVASGISSGEGIVDAVHDAEYGIDKKGRKVLRREAVSDKRKLFVEEEFSRLLKVAARENNIASQVLRTAWDGGDLQTVSKVSPLTATEPCISLIGHITRAELMHVQCGSSVDDGYFNRFLWCYGTRSKILPFGGDEVNLDDEISELRRALASRQAESDPTRPIRMTLSASARGVWPALYEELTAPCTHAMKARGAPMVLRIALIFAFWDGAGREIEARHIIAAAEIVAYSSRTADWILSAVTASSPRDRVLSALQMVGEMSSCELLNHFNRNMPGRVITEVLNELARDGLVTQHKLATGKAGRPATIWRVAPPRGVGSK